MTWIAEPFAVEFVQRAFAGGPLIAVLCGVVLTVVASYQAVGSLLVVGSLLAPERTS